MAACAEIDLAGLRRYRRRPGMGNLLSRQPIGLWREALAGREVHPNNSLLDARGAVVGPSPAFYLERQKRVIEALEAAAGHHLMELLREPGAWLFDRRVPPQRVTLEEVARASAFVKPRLVKSRLDKS